MVVLYMNAVLRGVTNGLAMTPKRYRALRAAGMHTATVSLDGLCEEHNFMRGNKQSYTRAIDALRMMGADEGFVFDVVTCVNSRNVQQLDEIKEVLVEIGVTRWRLFTIFPSGRAATDDSLQLSAEEFRFLMDYIKRHDFKVFGWYRIILGVLVLAYFGIIA